MLRQLRSSEGLDSIITGGCIRRSVPVPVFTHKEEADHQQLILITIIIIIIRPLVLLNTTSWYVAPAA